MNRVIGTLATFFILFILLPVAMVYWMFLYAFFGLLLP